MFRGLNWIARSGDAMSTPLENNAELNTPPSPSRIALAFLGPLAVFAVLLMAPAGRLDWFAGWLYLAIVLLNTAASYAYLKRINPAVIENRARVGKGTKTWDKIWAVMFAPFLVAVYVVAALDAGRFGWSAMPPLLWLLGFAVFQPGTMLFTWSMGVNRFFEKTVRIQTERGHEVIDSGPYRFVRHPGYVGFAGWIISAPLLLGSWWAFIPAVIAVIAVIVRTALEDRTLRDELPGYADYAARVRFRLLPGIW